MAKAKRGSVGAPKRNTERDRLAREAGLSRHQLYQALAVGQIPEAEFEALVEGERVPSVDRLARIGRQRGGRGRPRPATPRGWTLTEADVVALRAVVKRAERLSAKGSPEVEAVRGQLRAALASGGGRTLGDNLAAVLHRLTLAEIAKDGPDPEVAVGYLAEAVAPLAALVRELRRVGLASAPQPSGLS